MAAIEGIDAIETTRTRTEVAVAQQTAAPAATEAEAPKTSGDTVEVSGAAKTTEAATTASDELHARLAEFVGGDKPATRKVPEQAPPGFDQTKWSDPNHQTPKYIVGRVVASAQDELKSITDEAEHRKFTEDLLRSTIPAIEKTGAKVLDVKHDKILLDMNDGTGPHWCDAVGDCGPGGKNSPSWCVQEEQPADAQGASPAAEGAAPAGAAAPVAGAPAGASAAATFLLGLVRGGTSPEQACKMANERFGLKTGGEAVYYPDTNTIGLPECYLAGPTNKPDSPKEWGIVMRGQGGGGGGVDMSAFANWGMPSGSMSGFGMSGLGGWGSQWGGASAGAANGLGFMSMLGFGGMAGQNADPAVQQVIARVTAQGGRVLRADSRAVLAHMNRGQGPQWIPVGHHGHHRQSPRPQAWIA